MRAVRARGGHFDRKTELEVELQDWRRRWGAPYGGPLRHLVRPPWLRLRLPRLLGPFAFQPDNNETRRVEYPWAYAAVTAEPVNTLVEVSGSLAGLQSVLAKEGIRVINVKPGEAAARGWPVDYRAITRLNRPFGTSVELRSAYLQYARIAPGSADCVLSISTLEHIPPEQLCPLIDDVRSVLRPGGRFVATIDLFLDLAPFSDREENIAGTNIDVRELVTRSGLDLEFGDPSELLGFAAFNEKIILGRLAEYCYGCRYPAVAQAIVLRKPG